MSGWFYRNRHLYPDNWETIACQVKEAAGWRCEACGTPHGPVPCVLTVDHLDYNPGNNALSNLLALCQRCHLRRQALRPRATSRLEALMRLASRDLLSVNQMAFWELVT